ncbi:copper homeostasis protein CutC [bacterium]|nr:MAG: copper homeostasis protein CutC [bacterium]
MGEYAPPVPILVEIIGSTVDDCLAIEAAGADRVELCAALPLGGLTPSLGTLIEAKRRCRLPLMAMLRPREAGMAYTDAEWATMLADLPHLLDAGADGIVTGVSLPGGAYDLVRMETLARMVKGAGRPVELVSHRAFDLTPDPYAALEQMVDLGFDRILTSGQRPTAAEGAELIAGLVEAARGRIEILPACGIDATNAADLVARTGVRQIHLAAFGPVRDPSTREGAVAFGNGPAAGDGEGDDVHAFMRADADQIGSVVSAVN